MIQTLAVAAIKNGTVIDHIPAGQALSIIRLLKLVASHYKITIGMNLPSKQLQLKDLIKIEDRNVSADEANQIAIFAPPITINLIKDFAVVKKISTQLPEYIKGIFTCPNAMCITHREPVESFFYIEEQNKGIQLICKFCEKYFPRDILKTNDL